MGPAWVYIMAWHRIGDKPLAESMLTRFTDAYIDGLVQDCSNFSALAMELLQSCTKPSIYSREMSEAIKVI